jgi:antitoxin ParD1/3/4
MRSIGERGGRASRELLRADEKRKAEDRLKALLLEGLQGEEGELTRADWKDIRQEALAQVKARKNLG